MNRKIITILLICLVAGILAVALTKYCLRESRSPVSLPKKKIVKKEVASSVPSPTPAIETQTPISVSEKHNEHIMEELQHLEISESVRTITGLYTGRKDYLARMKAMRQLTRNIKDDDTKALVLFLDSRSQGQKDLNLLEFNGVKNDALDVLLKQEKLPDGLGSRLVEMYRDKEHDDVWRDYCVQYFAEYYKQKWPDSANVEKEEPERTEIKSAYWEAVTEKDKTIAGTALIGLESLSRQYKEIYRDRISSNALELANEDTCIEASRITALRICGMMKKMDVLPSARIVAQTGETITLRMAAIATIGDLGDNEDMELVKSLAADPEKRISSIAQSALRRLEKRTK